MLKGQATGTTAKVFNFYVLDSDNYQKYVRPGGECRVCCQERGPDIIFRELDPRLRYPVLKLPR